MTPTPEPASPPPSGAAHEPGGRPGARQDHVGPRPVLRHGRHGPTAAATYDDVEAAGWSALPRPARGPVVLFAVLAVALLAGAVALNVAVNPRGEFPHRGVVPSSEHDAVVKLWLLQDSGAAPQTLILGSSRAQPWDPAQLAAHTGGPAFNFAIAGALPTDQVLLYKELDRRGLLPRTMVVGLDVDAFSDQPFAQSRVAPLADLDRPLALHDWVRLALASLDDAYVRESLQGALDPGQPARGDRDTIWFGPDGLGHYAAWEQQVAAGTYDQAPSLRGYANATSLWTDAHPHPRQAEALRELARLAQEDGVAVVFVATPLHPTRLAALGPVYDAFTAEVFAIADGLCQPGVRLVDITDPAVVGGTGAGFYDSQHETPEFARKVVHGIATLPDRCASGPGTAASAT